MTVRADEARAVQARLRIRHWGCPASESLLDGAQASHVTSDRHADLIVMHGRDATQVDQFLEAVQGSAGSRPSVLARSSTTIVLRVRTPDDGVYARIAASGSAVLWPATWRGGVETYHVICSSREQLEVSIASLRQIAEVSIEELTDVEPGTLAVSAPLANFTAGLTSKQLEALTLAMDSGYFAMPRRVTTAQLAARRKLARSTFEEHLRKAVSKIFPRLAALLSAHPGLTEAAKGKRGRLPSRLRVDSRPGSSRGPR